MLKLNILKNKILKIKFLKNELKYVILKSIIQSKNIKPKIRSFAKYKIIKFSIKSRISFQKKVCLLGNKHRGVYPKLQLKKHMIKKLNTSCEIPNLKISK
jgi:hypothetical protein